MTNYRRNFRPGGSFFFTVALADRSASLLTAHVERLRTAFRHVRDGMPFRVEAMVVLPDHLHCLWTLPPADADFSTRWKRIKAQFSVGLPRAQPRSASRIAKGEREIWQRRFWEHTVRDEEDWRRHMDYIHYNPVKHRYVARVADWSYSSFHRYVRAGAYPPDWGGGPGNEGEGFGE
jgi:putative transposase